MNERLGAAVNFSRKLAGTEPLTPQQEHEIVKEYQQTREPRLRETLVLSNMRWVMTRAFQYRHFGIALDDLIAEGAIGLMKAIEKYDLERGMRLHAYATWDIDGAIKSHIRKTIRMVPLPEKIFNRLLSSRRRKAYFEGDNSDIGLAEGLATLRDHSLDRYPGSDEKASMFDTNLDDDDDPNLPTETMVSELMRKKIAALLEEFRQTLNDRELNIFDARIAAESPDTTLQELGDQFGVSRERIRQLESNIKQRLLR